MTGEEFALSFELANGVKQVGHDTGQILASGIAVGERIYSIGCAGICRAVAKRSRSDLTPEPTDGDEVKRVGHGTGLSGQILSSVTATA